jgi:TonB family protein
MKRLFNGFFASCLLHAALFGGSLGWIAWSQSHAPRSIDIDLSGSSLLMRPKNAPSRSAAVAPPQPWILAMKGHATPKPQAQPLTATAQPEQEAGPVCPPPCPQNANDWTPAAATSRRPEWDEGMITEDDYPSALKVKGVEGTVVVEVLIDASGNVKGVTLEQGSAPEFNQLVLDRLKRSKFRPAYDQNGNAVACRLRLPLRFKLSD